MGVPIAYSVVKKISSCAAFMPAREEIFFV